MNLLEGTINDEGVFVYDQSRKVVLPRERAAPLKGKRVVLGMRAEAARLVAPDAPGALVATADFIEELGASRIVHADFDGLPFAVALTEAVKVKSGDPIGIAIDYDQIHLYAADTGRIIENPVMNSAGAVHA